MLKLLSGHFTISFNLSFVLDCSSLKHMYISVFQNNHISTNSVYIHMCIYTCMYIYIYTNICVYIYIYTHIINCINSSRGKRLHTRNRHLRNHRGFSAAFSDGFSVAFSNGSSLLSGNPQRITFPVDLCWKCPMDCEWHFRMECHVGEFWCVIFCPDWRCDQVTASRHCPLPFCLAMLNLKIWIETLELGTLRLMMIYTLHS